jgi:peptide/nickel transport system substrate-binding protein
VRFSLGRLINEGALDGRTSPRRSLLAPISELRVEDDRTVRIKTRYPWPTLLSFIIKICWTTWWTVSAVCLASLSPW